jgi:perosamine synthetase
MIPHSRPTIIGEEAEAMARVLASGQLAQGREVEAFEHECATRLGRKHGVAVNSGTAALHLALLVLGAGEGDTVALPSYACASLAQAVAWQGANSLLGDVDDHFNLDAATIPDDVTAVIVTHLFGATATLPKHPKVVEDLAQSFGGDTGRGSAVAITSFYATKVLTTGEGGMLFTDDDGLAEMARDRRDYDNRDDFQIRYAYKMTEFQAAMGRVQLRHLPSFLSRRREIAERYHESFGGLPLILPRKERHIYFRYVVSVPEATDLIDWLRAREIGAARPVHRPAHHTLGGAFQGSEQAHRQNVSLPIYPGMTEEEVSRVVECVVQFFGGKP